MPDDARSACLCVGALGDPWFTLRLNVWNRISPKPWRDLDGPSVRVSYFDPARWNPAPTASRSNQGIDPCPAESLRRALEPRALGGLRGGAGEEIVGLDDEWNAAK
jgi:hypothetical protein